MDSRGTENMALDSNTRGTSQATKSIAWSRGHTAAVTILHGSMAVCDRNSLGKQWRWLGGGIEDEKGG